MYKINTGLCPEKQVDCLNHFFLSGILLLKEAMPMEKLILLQFDKLRLSLTLQTYSEQKCTGVRQMQLQKTQS